MTGEGSIPGVRVHELAGRFPPITTISSPELPWPAEHQRAWERLCAASPKLHDGPIWAVKHASASGLTVTLDRYKRLAVQVDPAVGDLGIRHVGVKGLTTAIDAAGVTRTLLARRGVHTRAYPNLWEIAPAGGVEGNVPLTPASIVQTLIQEADEELGIEAGSSASAVRPMLLLEDENARSVVLIARLPWPGLFDPRWTLPSTGPTAWEYSAARWLTDDALIEWLVETPETLTPPTRASLTAHLRL
ncbi:MAG TPA: hypothetical protein VEB22_01845 [Phycisphaerales bacterium]|nr:hypothetical protein [Phycisphaerales bacterium]